jgi:hypothetical protein
MGRLEEARKAFEVSLSRKQHHYGFALGLYLLDFLVGDAQGMASQSAGLVAKSGVPHEVLSGEADTAAYSGHLAKAREPTRQAADSSVHAEQAGAAAMWRLNAALREAAFGQPCGGSTGCAGSLETLTGPARSRGADSARQRLGRRRRRSG